MRKAMGGLLALLTALALAACGSSATRTVVQTVTVGGEPTPTTTFESEPPAATTEEVAETDCDALGINPDVGNEGRCESDGQAFAVVNRSSELKLKTIAVKVDDISTTSTIADEGGETSTANDTYVVVRLTIRNRANSPQTLDSGMGGSSQVILGVNGRQFTPDFEVQNGYAEDSFLWQSEDVQPGSSQTGTVVFDIPERAARQIDTHGQLEVLDFGNSFNWLEKGDAEIGVIRLWK